MVADRGGEISVRTAELRDVSSIRSIDRQVFARPWSEKLTKEQLSRSVGRHYVAETNRIVAHAGMAFVADDAHITTIAVDPHYQRLGIASQLVEVLIAEASRMLPGSLTLEVRVGNTAAIALYERCLLYTSPSPRDRQKSRMPSSA